MAIYTFTCYLVNKSQSALKKTVFLLYGNTYIFISETDVAPSKKTKTDDKKEEVKESNDKKSNASSEVKKKGRLLILL